METTYYNREENFSEYFRLLQDDNYTDVLLDDASGGVSAVHKQHKFAKQKGVIGMPQGEYERDVVKVMREGGHRIILGAEKIYLVPNLSTGFWMTFQWRLKRLRG